MKKQLFLAMTLGCSMALAQDSYENISVGDGSGTVSHVGFSSPNNRAPAQITQNTSSTIITTNSVNCPNGDNHYWRRFDLDGQHGISNILDVSSVDFGVAAARAPSGSVPVEVRVYSIANADSFVHSNLTLLGSAAYNVPNTTGTAVMPNVAVTGSINGSSHDLVVEIYAALPFQAGVQGFLYGYNKDAQTGPSYLSSPAIPPNGCNLSEPTDLAAINVAFADMSLVMAVNGNTRAAVVPPVPSTGAFGVMLMILSMLGLGWFTARRFQ